MTLPPELREKAKRACTWPEGDYYLAAFFEGVEWLYGEYQGIWADRDLLDDANIKLNYKLLELEAKLKAAEEEKDKLYKLLSGEVVDMWCEKPGHNIVLKNFKVSDD